MDDDLQAIANKAKRAEARHSASSLLRVAKIESAPVQIRDIVQHLPSHFKLVIKGSDTHLPNGLDAFTYKDPSITIIGYNKNVAVVRQRFSVAHEIGHLLMGHLHGKSSVDLDTKDFDEIEANQFAAQLLMPPEFLRADIKKGLKDPKSLAKKYQVSEEAVWWQISSSGLLNLF